MVSLLLLFQVGLNQGDGGSDVKGKYVRSREGGKRDGTWERKQ
jgi:hypothetical protein